MKILITENHYNLLLTEASKQQTLMDKLYYTEDDANELVNLCGALSVWVGRKLFEHIFILQKGNYDENAFWHTKRFLQGGHVIGFFRSHIIGLMDYIRVGLNSNITEIKDKTFKEMIKISDDWHKNLIADGGTINYNEENEIIRDYRKNNIGFYWVNLNTSSSEEECNRMGHCGRTNQDNTLFSLRENKKLGNYYYVNVSHITAAVGKEDNIIYQMKGQKNSKPKEKYHPYILDLIKIPEYVKGFGFEYEGGNDFKISDLNEEQIKELYGVRPDLFGGRREQRLLRKMGIIEDKFKDETIVIRGEVNELSDFVDGDVRHGYTRNGMLKPTLFVKIMYGEVEDTYYRGSLNLTEILQDVDQSNINLIKQLLAQRNQVERDGTISRKASDMALDRAIKLFGTDIEEMLYRSANDAIIDAVYTKYHTTLRACLEEYGKVLMFDSGGFSIEIKPQKYFDKIDEEDLENYEEDCNGHSGCMFKNMVKYGLIEKPKFYIDDRWSPIIDETVFNDYLKNALDEL